MHLLAGREPPARAIARPESMSASNNVCAGSPLNNSHPGAGRVAESASRSGQPGRSSSGAHGGAGSSAADRPGALRRRLALRNREPISGARAERLPGVEDDRGPACLADVVWRIRVVLGLQREPGRLAIDVAARANQVTD